MEEESRLREVAEGKHTCRGHQACQGNHVCLRYVRAPGIANANEIKHQDNWALGLNHRRNFFPKAHVNCIDVNGQPRVVEGNAPNYAGDRAESPDNWPNVVLNHLKLLYSHNCDTVPFKPGNPTALRNDDLLVETLEAASKSRRMNIHEAAD